MLATYALSVRSMNLGVMNAYSFVLHLRTSASAARNTPGYDMGLCLKPEMLHRQVKSVNFLMHRHALRINSQLPRHVHAHA